MGTMKDKRQKFTSKAEKEILEEMLQRLEKAIELKDQGKEKEGDNVVNGMKQWLDDQLQEIEAKLIQPKDTPVERNSLPKEGEVIAEGNLVRLSVIKNSEKENYLAVSYEYSMTKHLYKDEKYREYIWSDFISDYTFVCSIYEKDTGEYVGYCSIKDLAKKEWELAIELMPEKCHKGYGSEALPLLMKTINRLTGRRFFRSRVDIDNHNSQKLMKKLGAYPDGISEWLLHGDEIGKFQEEYKDSITEEIRDVAEEFCMDAEDILGYVLEYRFDMNEVIVMSRNN